MKDPKLNAIYLGLLAILCVASAAGFLLEWKVKSPKGRETVDNINARIRAWWIMIGVFFVANLCGHLAIMVLFGTVSFLALREFVTLSPTRRGDHSSLLLAFFLVTPLQYWLVGTAWYGMFTILIPVYAFLFIPTLNALRGDSKHFLERTAKLQWAMMVCVYCLSHAPALFMLDIPGYKDENEKLLLFLLISAQLSDVLQYIWGKTTGKRKVAPNISPNKTVEGLVGGLASITVIGACLYWATPFSAWQAAFFSFVIAMSGFFGGLTMSAIKRDRGVKDYGTIIEGHGGVLDRLDSICFAAPIFFHLVRYFFSVT